MARLRSVSAVLAASALLLAGTVAAPAAHSAPKESPAPPPNTVVEINCRTDIFNDLGLTYVTGSRSTDPWIREFAGTVPTTRPVGFGDKTKYTPDYQVASVVPGVPPRWKDAGTAAILCRWDTFDGRVDPEGGTVWLTVDTENKVNMPPDAAVHVTCESVSGQYIAPENFTNRWQPVDPSQPSLAPVDFGERSARFVWDDPNANYGPVQNFSLLPPFGPKSNVPSKKTEDCSYSAVTYTTDRDGGVTGTVYGTFTAKLKK